jgi:hypothetical protein
VPSVYWPVLYVASGPSKPETVVGQLYTEAGGQVDEVDEVDEVDGVDEGKMQEQAAPTRDGFPPQFPRYVGMAAGSVFNAVV